jgi:uncharacterized protein (TIGR02145 family)
MKKFTLFFSLLITIVSIQAQDYKISFEGAGASKAVDTIKIENLTQGKSMNLFGSEILHLVGTITGLDPTIGDVDNELRIFPNPMTEYSTIEFVATTSDKTSIELFDITGKSLASALNTLPIGTHSFKVSGLSSGIYTLRINSPENIYTGKLVSLGGTGSEVKISYLENKPIAFLSKKLKSFSAEKIMQYTAGDRLKITGTSGIYSTIVVDVPTKSKTITFNFISCTDADGNNYPVVKIGNQIWMAENLKTTRYKNGNLIATTPVTFDISGQNTPKYQWAYDGIESNKNVYGRLYTWYAANDTGIIAPEGWRVPSYDDWLTLDNYLGGESVAGGKLKETGTLHWLGPNTGATNESGFSALPGGSRSTSEIFKFKGELGRWWSSTEENAEKAFGRIAFNTGTSLDHYSYHKNTGFSIRCVRNYIPIDSLDGKSAYNKDISPAGGEFVISGINDSINGISLSVPPNAFSGTHNFKIYAEPLPTTLNTFGAKPLSHLICIKTDIAFSDSIINISIPINLLPNSIPMGFYYNPETNELEALSIIKNGQNNIQLALRRFNTIEKNKSANIFESIKLLILGIEPDPIGGVFETGFLPQKDGWDFINFGSYIEPRGICSGMTVSAIWYYLEKYKKENKPRLFGQFDKLPNLSSDNPIGIRFASLIQIWFYQNYQKQLIRMFWPDAKTNFWLISWAIKNLKKPVLINGFTQDNKTGHAFVVYKVDISAKKVYLYDPNRYDPKNLNQEVSISFDGSEFEEYTFGETVLKRFFFVGDAWIDYSSLNYFWDNKEKKSNEIFPKYELNYKYIEKQTVITKDTINLDSEIATINLNIANYSITPDISVYDDKGIKLEIKPITINSSLSFSLDCKSSFKTFGFIIKGFNSVMGNGFDFIDFKWVTFKQEQYSIAIVSGDNQPGASLGGKLPSPIKVIVKDIFEKPVKGAQVYFEAKNGGSVSLTQVTTGEDGTASVIWTLGPTDSPQTVTVKAFKSDKTTPLQGSPSTFTASLSCSSFMVDGYEAVQIGTQIWMAKNLSIAVDSSWVYPGAGSEYGRLYSWEAAKKACPAGWHLPSKAEWEILSNYLGGDPGAKLKEIGTAHWASDNMSATNSSCFNALPGGYRMSIDSFHDFGGVGMWWTSTGGGSSAYSKKMFSGSSGLWGNYYYVQYGYSVRCIKD